MGKWAEDEESLLCRGDSELSRTSKVCFGAGSSQQRTQGDGTGGAWGKIAAFAAADQRETPDLQPQHTVPTALQPDASPCRAHRKPLLSTEAVF